MAWEHRNPTMALAMLIGGEVVYKDMLKVAFGMQKLNNTLFLFETKKPNVDLSRNILTALALKEKCEWILFLDADIVPPLDVIPRLLEHNLPIVSALYWRRADNLEPCLYKLSEEGIPVPLDEKEVKYGDSFREIEACVPPGHLIQTFLGFKPIEEIKIGELIQGNPIEQYVLQTHEREYDGCLVGIKVRYLEKVYLTENHQVKIRKRTYTRKKVNGKWVAEENWKPFEWIQAGQLTKIIKPKTKNIFCLIPKEKEEIPYKIRLEGRQIKRKEYELNKNMAKLLGLWFAEGSAFLTGKYSKYEFAFGKTENRLITWTCDALKEMELNPFIREIGPVTKIHGNSKPLVNFLKKNFGSGAKHKTIPIWLLKERKEIIREFVDGLVLGDGNTAKSHKSKAGICVRVKLANKLAILQLQQLLRKLGILATYRPVTTKSIIRGKEFISEQHQVSWTINSKRRMFCQDENYFYVPISKIDTIPYQGKVYNLTTTEGIFLMPFIVHNCGAGCLLIHMSVFEKMKPSVQKFDLSEPGTNQKLTCYKFWEFIVGNNVNLSEDIVFASRIKGLGYRIYADLTLRCGHLANAMIIEGKFEQTPLATGRDI